MIRPYYLGCLAHASYLLADEEAKTAIVVDPQRDIAQYLEDARRLGVSIDHVVLTHLHADFVAGHLELAAATGATIHLGHAAEAEYDVSPLHEGDAWDLPTMRVEVWESPGHTPEMVSLVIFDKTGTHGPPDAPYAVLTGDTLFNGDVGRPDLLASQGHTAEQLAGMLFDSVQRLAGLPDATRVYPAHGAGSMCGKNIAAGTETTIGAQKAVNPALRTKDRDTFIRHVTSDLPAAPPYFAMNADMNRRDRPLLGTDAPEALDVETLLRRAAEGAQVVDTRADEAFADGHLAGSINIGLDGTYATWCGTVLDADRPILIIADDMEQSIMRLGRIGYEVDGYLEGGFASLASRPDLVTGTRIDPAALRPTPDTHILDVRSDAERAQAWIPDSQHIPLDRLRARMDDVPTGPVVVYCAGGYRSSLAASLLRAHGRPATDLRGGIEAYARSGPIRAVHGGIEQVTVHELPTLLERGATVLDVREEMEWHEGRIPGTELRPMSRFQAWATDVPKQEEVVLQCRSGNRSQQVAMALRQMGHDNVRNLHGGIMAWTAAGKEVL